MLALIYLRSNDTAKRWGLLAPLSPVILHLLQPKSPLLSNTVATLVEYLKSVSIDSYFTYDYHDMEHSCFCKKPAGFHSGCWLWKNKWSRTVGSTQCSCSAQCIPWNKSHSFHCVFIWCLLRDASSLGSIFSDTHLLQRLAKLTASLFMNRRVHKVET